MLSGPIYTVSLTFADDSIVNNAGVAHEHRTPAVCHLTDEDVWDTTMRVNVKSVFLGCKYATAQMLKQTPHSSGDRGWIINISSIMGIVAALDNRKYNQIDPPSIMHVEH